MTEFTAHRVLPDDSRIAGHGFAVAFDGLEQGDGVALRVA
jgi:hypothetical protein